MTNAAFIAVEWGTARISARLIAPGGAVIDSITEDVRLIDLDPAERINRLHALRERWPDAAQTIWLAGMIGSPMGIEAVTQLPCPAAPADLGAKARIVQIDKLRLAILPGLSCVSRFGDPDVLRGEEVAAAGLIDRIGNADALLLSVPGMHGKWLALHQGRIEHFHTSMTVELYRALADRSILAPLMAAPGQDGDAFQAGLGSAAAGGSLARLLFSARTAVMAKRFSEAAAASFIWGLVIGADVRENLDATRARACFVTGARDVAPLFCAAINHLGGAATLLCTDQLSAAGFAQIRRANAALENAG